MNAQLLELITGNEGLLMVRMEGLEPPRLAAPDPKSGAATNYATSACRWEAATRLSGMPHPFFVCLIQLDRLFFRK